MSFDLAPALALAGRYKLALPARPLRGPAGDLLARDVGSSVEFQDFRPYVPGDDPRYIDWSAVARTDQLIIRLHRAEVSLSLDVLLDTSRSIALGQKARRAVELAGLLVLLGRRAGARTTLWAVGDEAAPFREGIEERIRSLAFDGRSPLSETIRLRPPRLAAGSLRFLVSDFLFPHDPRQLQAFLAQGAAGGAFVQILGTEEEAPPEEGHVRLRDVETGEERQIAVSSETIRLYLERLLRLKEDLAGACRAARLQYASLTAERPLEALCRGPLLEAGILEPA